MTVRALNIYLSLGGQFPLLLSVPGFSSFKLENVSLVPAKSYPVPEHTHKEETSQNEHYYSCLIHEPWRDLWHGVRFKLFSLWTCQRQERQWKIHQNLLLEKKKIWDFCCIVNSHAAKSGDLRWSQSFFQDLGYVSIPQINLGLQWQLLLPDQSWFSLQDVFWIK